MGARCLFEREKVLYRSLANHPNPEQHNDPVVPPILSGPQCPSRCCILLLPSQGLGWLCWEPALIRRRHSLGSDLSEAELREALLGTSLPRRI